MADIKYFVAKTTLTSGGRPKRSSLLQQVHKDSITVKHMSRDGLAALIHKHRQRSIPRSTLNDTMLQNIKEEQKMAKLLQEKLSSLPELRTSRSRQSTASLANSNTLLRTLSPDMSTPPTHGYRYRSNGDVRFPRKNCVQEQVNKYEDTHKKNFTSLKQTLLKATMIHSRNEKGEYMYGPMLNELLKRESRTSKMISEVSDNIDIFRFITKDHLQYRQVHPRTANDVLFRSDPLLRDKPLIGRKYYVKENNRFVNSMMQQIYHLERNTNSLKYLGDQYETPAFLKENEIPLKGGSALMRSDPSFMSARHTSNKNMNEIPLTHARSSFSMRYGVSSKVLESRKPLLDEFMNVELKNLSKTDEEINEYIKEIQEIVLEKEKKRSRKEARGDKPFDLWQAETSTILDSEGDVPTTVPSHTEVVSDPATPTQL